MGRKLKRVPLDFDYPIGEVWEGYSPSLEKFQSIQEIVKQVPEILNYSGNVCSNCDKIFNNCDEDARYCVWYNQNLKKLWYYDVPQGEGYQLWGTTTEGNPLSPVFKTLEELCEWASKNATTFAHFTASKEEWMVMLDDGNVHHREGNFMFI